MRSIIPPHVYRQIKNPIPGPDHSILVELVRNSKTWLYVVPVGKRHPARVASRGHQVIGAFQIRKRGRNLRTHCHERASFCRVESDDAIESLRPVALEVNAYSQIQSDLPGQLIRVAPVNGLVKVLVGCSGGLNETPAIPSAQQERCKTIP